MEPVPLSTIRSTPSRSDSFYNPEAPSLIPVLKPKWNRTFTSHDTRPSLVTTDQEQDQTITAVTKETICPICQIHMARYECPRCEVPYCSVPCYKEHGGADGSDCTEGFYQDRVSSELALEAKEGSKAMEQILSRTHEQQSSSADNQPLLQCENDVSEEDLWKLADALENSDLDATVSLMTPEVRQAFANSVKRGELSHVLESWHPWWISELVASGKNVEESENHMKRNRRTLDERLLEIPLLNSLRVSPVASASMYFNLIDILYNISSTLRLYHGVENALAASQEAASTLLTSSTVLGKDARYASMEEALLSCTSASTQSSKENGEYNTHWTVLAEDVALMLSGEDNGRRRLRFVARALLEAVDIFKFAARRSKKQEGGKKGNDTTSIGIPTVEWKKARKKLEFYLSWSQDMQMPMSTSTQIREWTLDWKLSKDADMIETLRLTHAPISQSRQNDTSKSKDDEPLLSERSTRMIS